MPYRQDVLAAVLPSTSSNGESDGQQAVQPYEENTALTTEDILENTELQYELTELRTENTKHFQLSNGNRIAITYPEAVHYEENGEWKEIDNTLIYESALTPEDLIGYATQAGSVKYKFAENGEAEALVRLTMEDYSVLFSLAEEQAGEALLPDISEDTEESGAETSSEIPVQAEQPEMTEDSEDTVSTAADWISESSETAEAGALPEDGQITGEMSAAGEETG